ncbi:MAG: high-potential iron-sulfur protein [Burkholderiales bacterium]|nr:high-potential iron-sulfur protein [Burkholderiales bacterium]
MMHSNTPNRRRFILLGTATVAGTLLASGAAAQTNVGLRSALKYQDTPKGPQRCDNCMHWVPGSTPTARGGCKVIPGDKEIAPQGWCTAWAAVPAKK